MSLSDQIGFRHSSRSRIAFIDLSVGFVNGRGDLFTAWSRWEQSAATITAGTPSCC